ncbi:NAD(P)-binding protein [bacterium]|nr:NAD(P)-binding protein [bacterium]
MSEIEAFQVFSNQLQSSTSMTPSTPQKPTVAIVGGGIAGLSAGIFGRINGFDTTIYETNGKLGGVCSGWERSGYNVNGSVHWLVGSAPGNDLYELWKQLGVIEGNTFYNHDAFVEFRDLESGPLRLDTDADRLEKTLLDRAPEDRELILKFTEGIRIMARSDFPLDRSFELLNPWDWTKILFREFPAIRTMAHWGSMSLGDFAQLFKNRDLRTVFQHFWTPEMNVAFLMMQFGYASAGSAGYPLGGSAALIERLEHRYRTLEGKVALQSRVSKIAIHNGRAQGIQLSDGTEIEADFVVTACDGHSVLYSMLDPEWIDPEVFTAYEILKPFPSLNFFSAGFRSTFQGYRPSIAGLNVALTETLELGRYAHPRTAFNIFTFDPTLAPSGRTLVTAMLDADYDYWDELYRREPRLYQAERERVARVLIDSLDRTFPDTAPSLDFADLATPLTYRNWTGNHKGSYEGWLPTPEAMKLQIPTHFTRLKGLYMAGHWVAPGGGMPPAAYTGRDAIQLICRDLGRIFDFVEQI